MDSPAVPNPGGAGAGWREVARPYAVRSQRERLREAMVRVAATKGYEATTVADVVEMAGVTEEDFYALFPDRDACFMEAFDAVNDIVTSCVARGYEEAEGSWPSRMVSALRALVELLAAESEVARMTMIEVIAAGEQGRERYRRALSRLEPILDEGRDVTPGGSRLPPETARLAIGAATSLIFDEIRGGRGAELEHVLPELARAVLAPYLGDAGAEAELQRLELG